MLVNLQPHGKPMDVEVRLGDRCHLAGVARDCPTKLEDMKASLATLARSVASGLFSLRNKAVWQFEMHYSSSPDWMEFVNKPTCGGIEADRDLLDAALSQPGGRIATIEETFAVVYERLDIATRP